MKVTHEGNTYSLPVGETTVYDIRLQEGDNYVTCLLYTSDAADEEDSVDLGGSRIIKKKKNWVQYRRE